MSNMKQIYHLSRHWHVVIRIANIDGRTGDNLGFGDAWACLERCGMSLAWGDRGLLMVAATDSYSTPHSVKTSSISSSALLGRHGKYAFRMISSGVLLPTKTCTFAPVAFRAGIISLSVEWNYVTEGGEDICWSSNASDVFGRKPTVLFWLFVDLFSPSRHTYG